MHFYWKVCNFAPKVNWPRMERIWTSSVHLCFVSSSPYLHGLKSARKCHFCFASLDIKSSRWKIWGVFFEFACTYQISDFLIPFHELHQCNTTFLPLIVRPSAFFLVGSDRIFFSITSKTNYNVLSFLSLFIFFCCSTAFTAVVVSWMIFIEPFWASVRWWHHWCRNCSSGLVKLEKTWTSVMQLSLGPGAKLLFRHKWRKLDTIHTLFIVLLNILAL